MALAALCISGDVAGAPDVGPLTEVVVTLSAPPLAARGLAGAAGTAYARRLAAAQAATVVRVEQMLPGAHVRWRYHIVANGFAVALPRSELARLAQVPGVARVWPNVRYHSLGTRRTAGAADLAGPQVVGASQLWGADLATAGNGMKIGIIDDGLDARHPYFSPSEFTYPAGFPKGDTRYTTPKVIVQRTFAPPSPSKNAALPFDPVNSFHATHVAGIAAGDHDVSAAGTLISGIAPNAYLGNYKALTTPTPGFGLDGNSAEIVAAIEAAVADGMNVINLSLGEPEVEPSRDIVVQAIEAAAAAGVVPVVAAGNDFDQFGYGSIGSPGNAPSAITVAASSGLGPIATFSSAGPTPVSAQMKPDVTAPGEGVLSSLPQSQGLWGSLSGTSMATPHVAGVAALLAERHPDWTVAQIKSALVLTGVPVLAAGSEEPTTREGGGEIDARRADVPLVFATPSSLSFGVLRAGASLTRTISLADAGGGAGTWTVTAAVQGGPGTLIADPTVTVPGTLSVTATATTGSADVTGFVTLSNGTDTRRVPVWFAVGAPLLGSEPATTLTRPGTYSATTVGRPALVDRYRYPTGGDLLYRGPERVFRLHVDGTPANLGVVVLSGNAVPHVVVGADENRLAGYAGLPIDLNPYRDQFGAAIRVAGAVLPAAGTYDLVFDTASAAAAGPFTFRLWVNDTRPPTVVLRSRRGKIVFSARDAGAGVDPASIVAKVDGRSVTPTWVPGAITIPARVGRHEVSLSVADYQETKNTEDVAPILPNTTTVKTVVTVLPARTR